jgi:succinate dehydrogenase / fumarate reductase membrane anchor subunit
MEFLTDRKRAVGRGSARDGTRQHWAMTVSSVGLLFLVPLFVFTFGPMLGATHEEVVSYYSRPFPAVIAALTIVVGFLHFKNGVRVLLEDYVHGYTREVLIILSVCGSYAAIALGLYGLAGIAF